MNLSWMAWTLPTAIFFITIASLLLMMSVWEAFKPGGGPRVGILRFETTRGDRSVPVAARQCFYQSGIARVGRAEFVVGSGVVIAVRRVGVQFCLSLF